jgi:5-methylcytosine-specific restriction endonuclease McrA
MGKFTLNKKKNDSNYIGVYKCNKTNKYYAKSFLNKKLYTSKLFENDIDASIWYQNFISTNRQNKSCKPTFSRKKSIKRKSSNKLIYKKNKINKKTRRIQWNRDIIYHKQNDKCSLCAGSLGEYRTIDHIFQLEQGGPDEMYNLQALCAKCNKWKTSEWDHTLKKKYNVKNMNLCEIKKLMHEEYNKKFENFNNESNISLKNEIKNLLKNEFRDMMKELFNT